MSKVGVMQKVTTTTKRHARAKLAAIFVVSMALLLASCAPNPRADATADPGKPWTPNWIGLPWSGDSLSRMQVTAHSEVAFVFTATETSTLTSISPWIVANNPTRYAPCPASVNEDLCYSAGHGGTVRVDVYADDPATNAPTGPSLGGHTWQRPMVNGAVPQAGNFEGSWFGPLALTPAPAVEAGRTYHAVFTNPDPEAAAGNFYGLNFLSNRAILSGDLNARAQMPILPANRWDARFRARKSAISPEHFTNNVWRSCAAPQVVGKHADCWATQDGWYRQTPIVQYAYGNGKESGNGYSYPVLGTNPWGNAITDGNTRSRQVFRIDADKMIDQIGVRILPVAPGIAKLSVRRKADDAVLATVSIPFALPPTMGGTSSGSCQAGVRCGNNGITLVAPLPPTALAAGEYYVDFDRESGVYAPQAMIPFKVQPGNILPQWGPGTRWDEGVMENWTGSEWKRWTTSDVDAFVYLRIAEKNPPPTTTAPPAVTPATAASPTKATTPATPTTKASKKPTKKTSRQEGAPNHRNQTERSVSPELTGRERYRPATMVQASAIPPASEQSLLNAAFAPRRDWADHATDHVRA